MNLESYRDHVFEFGEFSTRALGITVKIPMELGRLIAPVVSLLLTNSRQEDRINDFRECIQREADKEAKAILAGYASAANHELRHFHDYVASPLGAVIISELMMAACHLGPIARELLREPVIGLPLQLWEALPELLHKTYSAQTRRGTFARRPPSATIPITRQVQEILKRREEWLGANKSNDCFLNTTSILEAAAIDVQSTHINYVLGYDEFISFVEYIQKRDRNKLYTTAWEQHVRLTQRFGPQFTAGCRNALYFYSLCGPATVNNPQQIRAHPGPRFMALTGEMLNDGYVPRQDNILDYINRFAAKMKLPNLEESLKRSVAFTREFAQKLEEANGPAFGPPGEAFFRAFHRWVDAHEYMATKIINDPMTYFDPLQYLQNIDNWVASPVYVFGSHPMFFDAKLEKKWLDHGWEEIWGEEYVIKGETDIRRKKGCLYFGPELTQGKRILDRNDAKMLSDAAGATHSVWAENSSVVDRKIGANSLKRIMQNPDLEILEL